MGLLRGADDFDRWELCLEGLRNQGCNLGRVIVGTGFRLLLDMCCRCSRPVHLREELGLTAR